MCFSITFQAGDGDSPEFVRISLCLGFLGNVCGEADLHIIREFPTGKYAADDVGQDGNDDGRCMLEMLNGDTEDVHCFVACQGPYMLQNLVDLNHLGWFTQEWSVRSSCWRFTDSLCISSYSDRSYGDASFF